MGCSWSRLATRATSVSGLTPPAPLRITEKLEGRAELVWEKKVADGLVWDITWMSEVGPLNDQPGILYSNGDNMYLASATDGADLPCPLAQPQTAADVECVSVTEDGASVILAGNSSDTETGDYYWCVASRDTDGNWSTQPPHGLEDEPLSVAWTPDRRVLVVTYNEEQPSHLILYEADGAELWTQTGEQMGVGDYIGDIATDRGGRIYITASGTISVLDKDGRLLYKLPPGTSQDPSVTITGACRVCVTPGGTAFLAHDSRTKEEIDADDEHKLTAVSMFQPGEDSPTRILPDLPADVTCMTIRDQQLAVGDSDGYIRLYKIH